jgi:predicted RNA-binding protein
LFNIISFGKKRENLVLAIEHQTLGSTLSTLSENIHNGSTIFLHCKSRIWATAEVTSDYFYSEEPIWKDKFYPHRFKFHNCKLLSVPVELSDGGINTAFRKTYGSAWAYRFLFSPKAIPQNIAKLIEAKIKDVELTDFETFKQNLFLDDKAIKKIQQQHFHEFHESQSLAETSALEY